MSQEFINNQEELLLIRTKINENFRELFNELSFISLVDTPNTFAASKFIRVNAAGTGLIYSDVAPPPSTYTTLTDTPNTIEANKYVKGNESGTGLEFGEIDITSSFIDLIDTPSGLQPDKYLKVTSQGDKLEFTDLIISTDFESLTDTPNEYVPERYVRVNTAGDALEYVEIETPITSLSALTDTLILTSALQDGSTLEWSQSHAKWIATPPTPEPSASTQSVGAFVDLTDTPATLDAGSYLRVNSDGTAVDQVKTAPPDGGIGDSSRVQAVSNFASKIPDYIVLKHSASDAATMVAELRFVGDSTITYKDVSYNEYYVNFNNNPAGDGWAKSGSHIQSPIDGVASPTLQQLIDGGHVVYLGEKSGTSGAGSLSVIKNASNFYTELPDKIVVLNGTTEHIMQLLRVDANYFHYLHEDFGDAVTDNRFIYFNNDADGSFQDKNTNYWSNSMSSNTLRWYIENGRAIYNGHTDNTGSSGTHPEIQAVSNFEGIIPDGVIMTRPSIGGVIKYQFNYLDSNYIYFTHWTDSSSTDSYYIRFNNDGTGSGLSVYGSTIASQYVTPNGETTLRQLIDNGNVVYHGGRSVDSGEGGATSVEQLTDVDTTTAPTDGQVLVYDDADSVWKPGAQSNDFVDLTDTPATLDAGSYLRVNTAGDAIEQIKTAPPDGGLGGNSTMQQASNFANKLPDAIVANGGSGNPVIQHLYYISTTQILYQGWTQSGTGAYYAYFNNDATGSNGLQNTSWSFLDGATTLQEIIDNGHAIYHGQKSGTSGVGSLSHVKTLANSSPNGGFYTELPDAIVAESTTATYNGVFKLHWIKPNATAGGTGWEIIYRTEAFSSGDYYIGYQLDADGTKVAHAGVTHTNATTKNLRWYVENGRALYLGGQQDFGVKAWGKFDGTGSGSLSFTGGNIQSITRVSTGLYEVTFINPAPHADYSVSGTANFWGYDGSDVGVRHTHNNDTTYNATTTSFHLEVRDYSNANSNSNRISFQVVW